MLKSLFKQLCLSVFLLCVGLSPASADLAQLGPNLFAAGVPSDQFSYYASPGQAGRQRQSNWCWAASIQMVLNYHGLLVEQEAIVERIYGSQVDLPAQPPQILAALSGWAPDVRGGYSAVQASPYTYADSQIVVDLANRWPLIVGLMNPDGRGGHAVVLTGVTYSVDAYNNPLFHSFIIRDPWPNSPSRQELSYEEFRSRLSFMAHVRVQPL